MAREKTEDGEATFKRVLVIDDDEVSRNLIANHMQALGAGEIQACEDGQAGWQLIQKERFDLVVLDWKLPQLSGLALFNRIRGLKDYRTVPLLVVSGFLEKNDFRLLQEFPCTALMEKPFTMVLFQNRLAELTREAAWYEQNGSLVDTLVAAVDDDGKRAGELLRQVLRTSPNPIPLAVVAARRLIAARHLKPARAVLESVLKLDDNCVVAMNELGKALHLMGDHHRAVEVLRHAHRLSPQNLGRLCLLGEAELNVNDAEAARGHFEKALEIDPDDATARAGLTVASNMQELLPAPDKTAVPRSFASILNTLGIALVRTGQYQRGIEQYRSALVFLRQADDSARVAFNLGLGYLRWGRPGDALPWFQTSERLAPSGSGKSSAYIRQLLAANVTARVPQDPGFARLDGRKASGASIPLPVDAELATEAPSRPEAAPAPFPVAAEEEEEGPAGSASLDDILEETVGPATQIVLHPASGREAPKPRAKTPPPALMTDEPEAERGGASTIGDDLESLLDLSELSA
jgi:CheY-like chemotaxis protein/Flp pilus assembly protein TadD